MKELQTEKDKIIDVLIILAFVAIILLLAFGLLVPRTHPPAGEVKIALEMCKKKLKEGQECDYRIETFVKETMMEKDG